MSRLFVDVQGSGQRQASQEGIPNLVLIHGWGMHGGVWQPVIKKLSQHFNLHIIDLPGMGFSRPIEPSHLEAVAKKVIEVLPDNADVCGWSFGTHIAMKVALMQPERHTPHSCHTRINSRMRWCSFLNRQRQRLDDGHA